MLQGRSSTTDQADELSCSASINSLYVHPLEEKKETTQMFDESPYPLHKSIEKANSMLGK